MATDYLYDRRDDSVFFHCVHWLWSHRQYRETRRLGYFGTHASSLFRRFARAPEMEEVKPHCDLMQLDAWATFYHVPRGKAVPSASTWEECSQFLVEEEKFAQRACKLFSSEEVERQFGDFYDRLVGRYKLFPPALYLFPKERSEAQGPLTVLESVPTFGEIQRERAKQLLPRYEPSRVLPQTSTSV